MHSVVDAMDLLPLDTLIHQVVDVELAHRHNRGRILDLFAEIIRPNRFMENVFGVCG